MSKIKEAGASPRGWHRLQNAAECLQRYAWGHEAPMAERPGRVLSPALVKGTLFHLVMSQHYLRMRDGDEWTEPVQALIEMATAAELDAFVPDVLRTYEAYKLHYYKDREQLKVLTVEEVRQKTYGGKYLLTGRIDMEVEDQWGKVFVVDHKTSGRITSAHQDYFSVSGQLIGYADMARQVYGDRLAGVIINLVQIGKETKFDRILLPRSPGMEARFEQNVIDIEESIERMKASGRPYDQWPRAMSELTCIHRYGPCNFIDQCRYGSGSTKAGNWKWQS